MPILGYVLLCMVVSAWVHAACMWGCAHPCVCRGVWVGSGVSGLAVGCVVGSKVTELWPRVGDSFLFSEWSSSSFLPG